MKNRMLKNVIRVENAALIVVFMAIGYIGLAAHPTEVLIFGLTGKVKRFDERRATLIEKNGIPKEEKSGMEKSLFFDEDGRLTLQMFSGTVI